MKASSHWYNAIIYVGAQLLYIHVVCGEEKPSESAMHVRREREYEQHCTSVYIS